MAREMPVIENDEVLLRSGIKWCRKMCRHGDNMCGDGEPCYVEDEKRLDALLAKTERTGS